MIMTDNILDENGRAEYCPITKSKSPLACMECPYSTSGGTNLNNGISNADCSHGDQWITNDKDFKLVTDENIIRNFDNFIRAAYENGKADGQNVEQKEGVVLSQIVQFAGAAPIVQKCPTLNEHAELFSSKYKSIKNTMEKKLNRILTDREDFEIQAGIENLKQCWYMNQPLTGFPYFFTSETSTDNSTAAIHGKPSLLQRIFKRHEHEKN
jgi:hypothetical protein